MFLRIGIAGWCHTARAQMPQPFMRRHQRTDNRFTTIGAGRNPQQHKLQCLEQFAGYLQFALVAGVVERRLDFVAQSTAVALLVRW